jgi:hypothetical protein
MRVLVLLIVAGVSLSAQTAQPIDTVYLDYGRSRDSLSLAPADSGLFLGELRKARTVVRGGVALWGAGLGLQLVSSMLLPEQGSSSLSLSVQVLGTGVALTAPIASCRGGDRVWRVMRKRHPGYPRHKGWRYYRTSWILNGLQLATALIGAGIAAGSTDDAVLGATAVVRVGLGLVSYLSYVRSVFAPLRYTRQALREVRP